MCPLPFEPLSARHPAGRARGLTLIELMVALVVLVIVGALAVPTMADFTANNQLSAAKSSLSAALALARSEAARRGLPVLVNALPGGGGGNEYAQGWEVVGDDNDDGTAADHEPRVRRQAALDPRLRISGPTPLTFRASGALAGGAEQVFTICRSDGAARGFRITVAPSGMADVARIDSCG